MTARDQAEAEIRHLLATEASAVRFSNKLFTPGGLFSRLFTTPEEKREVMASPLFEEAQKRLSELQRQEAARLVRGAQPLVVTTIGAAQLEQLAPAETGS
ncbi:MAG TPA: hypothetical protein VFG68_12180 [Fimbriiglobus sp.]|nr:hypothetical protein [Fimbriiglobus sp.]